MLDTPVTPGYNAVFPRGRNRGRKYSGGVAQLGERVNGIHEVSGSIPLGSTKFR